MALSEIRAGAAKQHYFELVNLKATSGIIRLGKRKELGAVSVIFIKLDM